MNQSGVSKKMKNIYLQHMAYLNIQYTTVCELMKSKILPWKQSTFERIEREQIKSYDACNKIWWDLDHLFLSADCSFNSSSVQLEQKEL